MFIFHFRSHIHSVDRDGHIQYCSGVWYLDISHQVRYNFCFYSTYIATDCFIYCIHGRLVTHVCNQLFTNHSLVWFQQLNEILIKRMPETYNNEYFSRNNSHINLHIE